MEYKYAYIESDRELIKEWGTLEAAYDYWDIMYGDGHIDYETYVLCDGREEGIFEYYPFRFKHKPFYVGHGKRGRRKKSCYLKWYEEPKSYKEIKLNEIYKDGGSIYPYIIGLFETKKKALLEEKKLIKVFSRDDLSNSVFYPCDIPIDVTSVNYKFCRSLKK